jgi:DNA replication protein DnaC
MTAMQLLEDNLRRLRLSGVAETLSVRIHEAENADLPYQEFLSAILTDELNRRTSNQHNRRLKLAKFPQQKTLDTFDFNFNQSVKKRDVLDLMTCRCLVDGRNALFLGPPGVGKTHLAIALGISAISKGYEVCYRSIFDFLEEMALAEAEGKQVQFVKRMTQVPLLIIDEFGMKNIPPSLSEDLLELFHRRHGCRSTVICTNRPVEDWGKIMGDIPAASAILDRFLEGVYLFKMSGKSYRLQGKPNPTGNTNLMQDKVDN